ncbi:hypothetical protein HQ529_05310 [Candidatus Woesearchaeota archaeon]|nr:hypothetical protein [Candidatus Woesearchaeota archaeon]
MKTKIKEIKLELISKGISTDLVENLITTRTSACNGIFLEFGLGGKEDNAKVNINPLSPYFLIQENDKGKIINDKGESIVDYVNIYSSNIKSDIFSPQLKGVLAVSLWGCQLVNKNQDCGFCAAKEFSGPKYSVQEFEQELKRIDNIEKILAVTINSGSIITRKDRGYNLMAPYVRVIKAKEINEINLELMPPNMNEKDLEELLKNVKQDGVSSMQFNMEIFDDDRRKAIMPYKGEISIEQYIKTIEMASQIFGEGKISSVLLVGLDSLSNLRKGAYTIINAGGIPSMEVFRSLKGTKLEKYSAEIEYKQVIKLNKDIKDDLIDKYGRNIFNYFEGCLKCGGCNILQNEKYIKQNNQGD